MLTKKNHLKSPPNIKARLSTPGTRHGGVLQTSYSIKGNGITALRECNTGNTGKNACHYVYARIYVCILPTI